MRHLRLRHFLARANRRWLNPSPTPALETRNRTRVENRLGYFQNVSQRDVIIFEAVVLVLPGAVLPAAHPSAEILLPGGSANQPQTSSS